MRVAATLAGRSLVHSSTSLDITFRTLIELSSSHGLTPGDWGNCHAHDLVVRWAGLTDGEPMPVPLLRRELTRYLFGDRADRRTEHTRQGHADRSLAEALLNGDVRLVRLPRRARR